jgi:two-component system sensor histidine kinase BaeS
MRRSLRVRLVATTTALVFGSIVAVSLLSSWASRKEFRRFEKILVTDAGKSTSTESFIQGDPGTEREAAFAGALNRGLVGGAAACAGAAFLLTLLFSRRIFGPVEALTRAARAMARGDREVRVDVRGGDEVGELGSAFNAMSQAVSTSELLRRRLVGDVAHELRTPLTNIRAQLEAIQDGLSTPGRPAIDSLHEEAMLLSRLVDELQDLAVAEAGEMKLERTSVPLREAAISAAAAFELRARAAGVAIRVAVPEGLTPVSADRRRLAQVLRNLLSNALAHTPAGGEVALEARAVDGGAEVAVRDSGCGIGPADLPFVFDRFYRADDSRSRETGGTGLGLSIVRQIVLAHGGQIRAESEPGRGAAFLFVLPFIENS